MKPKPVKQKPIIQTHIVAFFNMFHVGDMLRTEDVYKYVKRMLGHQMYPDTVLRYMRELRKDEVINYTIVSKSERIIKIIPLGEPHSL